MDEKRFIQILEKNNEKLMQAFFKETDEKFDTLGGRIDSLEGKFDSLEGKFDSIEGKFDGLEGRFDGLEGRFDGLEGRFDGLEGKFDGLEGRFDGLEGRFNGLEGRFDILERNMEQRLAEVEQKRIDDNFYFEHKYWDKISIIFDKLKLNDDLKKIEEQKNIKLQEKVENNSAKLMSLDFRVSQLEKNVNSK